jgi:hypothetical protein
MMLAALGFYLCGLGVLGSDRDMPPRFSDCIDLDYLMVDNINYVGFPHRATYMCLLCLGLELGNLRTNLSSIVEAGPVRQARPRTAAGLFA